MAFFTDSEPSTHACVPRRTNAFRTPVQRIKYVTNYCRCTVLHFPLSVSVFYLHRHALNHLRVGDLHTHDTELSV